MIAHAAMKALLLILAAALPLHAATTIEISARLADVPAGTEIAASATKLEKIKGVNVLSAPRIVTTPGNSGTIEITQAQSAPGGASVPLGVTLEITPTLDEKNINFSGRVIDRAIGGKRSEDRVTVLEFATREVYFSGSTNSGQTVLLRTSPAVSKSAGKTPNIKARELVILLTFSKRTSEPESPKKLPAKVATPKSGTSKKAPTTKVTPSKKK